MVKKQFSWTWWLNRFEETLDQLTNRQLEQFRQMIADEEYVRRHKEK
jgi:hypothetical protein